MASDRRSSGRRGAARVADGLVHLCHRVGEAAVIQSAGDRAVSAGPTAAPAPGSVRPVGGLDGDAGAEVLEQLRRVFRHHAEPGGERTLPKPAARRPGCPPPPRKTGYAAQQKLKAVPRPGKRDRLQRHNRFQPIWKSSSSGAHRGWYLSPLHNHKECQWEIRMQNAMMMPAQVASSFYSILVLIGCIF